MNIIELDVNGPEGAEKRKIKLCRMGAQEGWEIQRRYIEFAMSKDPTFRTQFTFEVLAFAKVLLSSGDELPLSTPQLVENHLQNWRNVEKVFKGVLLDNGIDPETHAEKEHYWMHAGGEMAAAFLQQTIDMLGPLLASAEAKKANK